MDHEDSERGGGGIALIGGAQTGWHHEGEVILCLLGEMDRKSLSDVGGKMRRRDGRSSSPSQYWELTLGIRSL